MKYLLAFTFAICGFAYLAAGLWEIFRMFRFGILPTISAIIYVVSILLIPLLSVFAARQLIKSDQILTQPWFYCILFTLVSFIPSTMFTYWLSKNSPIPFLNSPGQFIVYVVIPIAIAIYILIEMPQRKTEK